MKAIARLLVPLALGAVLAGCSLLPASRPLTYYQLPASTVAPHPGPRVGWDLRIDRPAASDLLASNRILVAPEANQLSAYAGVRWSSSLPTLWRERLMAAFLADGRVRHVSGDGDGLRADFELGGNLLAFHHDLQAGEPRVVIRLDARLVEIASRRILASRRFEEFETPRNEEVAEVVAAFGLAGDRLERALIDWTLAELDR